MESEPNRGEPGADRPRLPAARLRPRGAGQPPASGGGSGLGGSLFAPRSFAGGRVQVIGCSPGCLLVSLAASVVLTILLNLLLGGLF